MPKGVMVCRADAKGCNSSSKFSVSCVVTLQTPSTPPLLLLKVKAAGVLWAYGHSGGVSLSVKNRMKLCAPPLFNLQHSLCLKLYGHNLQAKSIK